MHGLSINLIGSLPPKKLKGTFPEDEYVGMVVSHKRIISSVEKKRVKLELWGSCCYSPTLQKIVAHPGYHLYTVPQRVVTTVSSKTRQAGQRDSREYKRGQIKYTRLM